MRIMTAREMDTKFDKLKINWRQQYPSWVSPDMDFLHGRPIVSREIIDALRKYEFIIVFIEEKDRDRMSKKINGGTTKLTLAQWMVYDIDDSVTWLRQKFAKPWCKLISAGNDENVDDYIAEG